MFYNHLRKGVCMKKRIMLVALALSFAATINAADWANAEGSCYAKGAKNVSVGGSMFDFGFFGAFDYGFHDCISGGIVSGFNGHCTSNWGYYDVPILARAGFHPFNLTVLKDKIKVRDKLDAYVGPAMGWQIGWTKWHASGVAVGSASYGGLIIREYIGARWYFTPALCVFAEDCAGLGLINIGASFKF
jgi:hypothetical protein